MVARHCHDKSSGVNPLPYARARGSPGQYAEANLADCPSPRGVTPPLNPFPTRGMSGFRNHKCRNWLRNLGRGCNSRRLHCISQKSLRCNDFGSGRTQLGFPPPRTSPITHQRWREPERPFPFRPAVTQVFGSQGMLQNPGRKMTSSLQRGQIAPARRARRLLAQIRLLDRVGDRVLGASQFPLPGWLFLLSVMLGRRTQEVA
jgi:hypothetical protein